MTNIMFNLEHATWYFFHVQGPDGGGVLLGKAYYQRDNHWYIFLPDDACTEYIIEDGRMHKWTVEKIEKVKFPSYG